jgi:hypothetical protein
MKFSRIVKIWTMSSCLHLDDRSTHKKNLEYKFGGFFDLSIKIQFEINSNPSLACLGFDLIT